MSDVAELEKAYAALQRKYPLPAFAELDSSFEIASIDASAIILREIRKKIEARLEDAISLLHGILQPEANMRDFHECRVFSEREKPTLFLLYRKLMIQRREASLLSLESEERKEAAFVSATFAEWQAVKQQLQDIVARMRDSWRKETSVKEELGYLG